MTCDDDMVACAIVPARLPANEARRLAVLADLAVLDSAPEDAFDRLTRLAASICEAPIALVSLVDRDRQWFKSRIGLAVPQTSRDVSFCAHTILDTEPLVIEDTAEDPRFSRNPLVVGSPHIRFYAGIPLTVEPEVNIGTLCVIDTRPRRLPESQITMLKDLAGAVVDALRLRRSVDLLEHRDAEIRDAYAALKRSMSENLRKSVDAANRHYAGVFEAAQIGLVKLSPGGRIVDANVEFLRMLGLPPHAVLGVRHRDLLSSMSRDPFCTELNRFRASTDSAFRMEVTYTCGGDRRLVAEVTVSRDAPSDERASAFVMTVRDIGARKHAENASHRLSMAATLSDNGMVVIDGQRRVLWENPAFERIVGASADAVLDHPAAFMRNAGVDPEQIDAITAALESGSAFSRELHGLRDGDEPVWVDLDIRPMRAADDTVDGFVGVIREITQRKRREQRQEIETKILEMLATEVPTDAVLERLCGMVEREIPKSVGVVMMLDESGTRLSVRSAPELPAELHPLLSGPVTTASVGAGAAADLLGGDAIVADIEGEDCSDWVRDAARIAGIKGFWSTPFTAGTGRTLGTFVVFHYAHRKQGEEQLHLMKTAAELCGIAVKQENSSNLREISDQRLREFLDMSMDWYWETDADHVYTFVSDSFEMYSGMPRSKIIGTNRLDFMRDIMSDQNYRDLMAAVEDHRSFKDMEFQIPESGRWVRVNGQPMRDIAGQFVGYRGTGRDVTYLRAAQEDISKSNRLLQRLYGATVEKVRPAEEAMTEILEIGCQEIGFDAAAIVDILSGAPLVKATVGCDRTWVGQNVSTLGTVCEELLANATTPEPIFRRAGSGPLACNLVGAQVIKRFCGVPITVRGKAVGTLCFFGWDDGPSDLVQADLSFLRLSALWIGQQMESERILIARDQSEQRLRDYSEAASDWLWETDEAGAFTYISGQVENRLALPVEYLIGKRRIDLISNYGINAEEASFVADITERRLPLRRVQFDVLDGRNRRRTLEISGKPIFDTKGRFTGYRGVGSDVTERRRLDESLAQAQKMEVVGQLASGISHDFKNLLTVMQGNLKLLLRKLSRMDGVDDALELTEEALIATKRGADLTRGLLSLSRKQQLEIATVDVVAVLKELHNMLRRTMPSSIGISTKFPSGEIYSRCDASYLHTAVLNLALNARDAMPEGGTLTLEAGYGDGGRSVVVSVSDTGVGIIPEIRDRIFEPLFTTKTEGKGSGLGLSMVKAFTSSIGGDVRVEDRPEGGTRFVLVLPAVSATLPDSEVVVTHLDGTILVADDDPGIRRLITQTLGGAGATVIEAEDAAKAEKILNSDLHIDLLLTDIQMPGPVDGLQLAIKRAIAAPQMPIMVITGSNAAMARARKLLPRAIPLLTKPFDPDALVDAVAQQLEQIRETGEV